MSCQHTNPPGYSFCSTCGAELNVIHCRCGFSNLPSSLYCGNCGLSLESIVPSSQKSKSNSPGKYNLDEFIEHVEIQRTQDDQQRKEQEVEDEKTQTMSQDDIADLFGKFKDNDE